MNLFSGNTKRFFVRLTLAGVALCTAGILFASWANKPVEISAYPDVRVLRTVALDGITYKLADDGNVFRVIDERGTWTWVDQIFDPEQIAREFVREGDNLFTVDLESGKRYPLSQHFEDGFEDLPEGVDGLRALIGEERKWTEFTLQSPETPTVSDYVDLRQRILIQNANFLDASVAPSSLFAHSGRQSLRCICPPRSWGMICTKASLGTGLIGFEAGDDLWFQAWYRIHGTTRPFTLADIEGRHVKESPGIRLMLFDGEFLGVELKALHKPKYQQPASNRVSFPTNEWVQVTMHAFLHPDNGHVQVWQGDTLVVDERGPTLPFSGMLYNSMEVGISAHSFGDERAELFVDDVVITTTRLREAS
jgi:hypothetical protein